MIHSLKIYAIKGISDGNNEFETIKNQIPEDIHKFTKDFIRFFNAAEISGALREKLESERTASLRRFGCETTLS